MAFFPKIFSLWGAGLPIVVLAVSPVLSGQDRLERREDGKLDRRVVEIQSASTVPFKEGVDISLVSSLAYDSNIFLEPEDETRSAVARIEPLIGWTRGSKNGTWIRLAYQASAVVYFSQTEDNRIDNTVLVEGGVKRKNLALAYTASWARLGSPSSDVGGQSDRNDYGGRVGLTYTPKGKISYEVFGERTVVDQVESGFFDFFQSSGGAAARYRYSSKTEVEAVYRYGRVDVDGAGTQTFQRLGVQALWRPRSKISVSFEGGVEFRDYEEGSQISPYFAARVDWRPRAKTALFLEGYKREEASAGVEGENFDVIGFRAGVNQQLRDGWSVGLEVGVETSDYFAITDLPSSGREDTIAFVRPSVRYAFGDDSELVFLYQWSENDSNDSDFGYTNQQLSASLNYRF